MKWKFTLGPVDEAVLPQVREALERRREIYSRKALPWLWDKTDRLTASAQSKPSRFRRHRRGALALVCWLLGLFLLMPGLMEPTQMLVPLLAGAVAYLTGMNVLNACWPRVLLVLSTIQAVVLTFGVIAAPEGLGVFWPLALAGWMPLFHRLLDRLFGKKRALDRDARGLLDRRKDAAGQVIVCTEEAITGATEAPLAWTNLIAVEAQDLFLIAGDKAGFFLMKQELTEGDLDGFRDWIGRI